MSIAGGGVPLASGVQGGHLPAPAHETLLIGLVIAAMVLVSVLIAIYLRRHHRRTRPVTDHWQALAVMGELCAHGWQAEITLRGWGAPLVELEWKQFDEESGGVAVARRVWAATIAEALQAMVEDRRTDVELERIEQAAADDDDVWCND